MAKPTLPDSPFYGESAVHSPASHQGSEPLTRSSPLGDARQQQPHTPHPPGNIALIFLIAAALGVAVVSEDAILRLGCTLVFHRAAAVLIQREVSKGGGDP